MLEITEDAADAGAADTFSCVARGGEEHVAPAGGGCRHSSGTLNVALFFVWVVPHEGWRGCSR